MADHVETPGEQFVDHTLMAPKLPLSGAAHRAFNGPSAPSAPEDMAKKDGEQPVPERKKPKVLVVEDEALVSLQIAQVLREAGFEVVGPARRVAKALELLEREGSDAAILDINLGNETSEAVAEYLNAHGTPFITLSGYSKQQQPPIFENAPFLSKPLQPARLVEEVKKAIDRKSR